MTTRSIALLFSLPCLAVLAPAAVRAEDDVKPAKKTAKAEDGVSIVYEVRGKGDTALVFLHGWCGDHTYWKNQVEVFAPDYRVVALDHAGHGESGKDRKKLTAES